MTGRRSIDISKLPSGAMDYTGPLWWGNTLLLVIETVLFALMVVSYFYIRLNYSEWPPPRVDREPILYHTAPKLLYGTLNLALLALSIFPAVLLDRSSFAKKRALVQMGLAIMIIAGASSIALRVLEFPAFHFRWNDNAYASIVWLIAGMHLLHLLTGTLEFALLASWTFTRKLDTKHARDVRLAAIYWYWIVGTWVILYAIIYWFPRLTGKL